MPRDIKSEVVRANSLYEDLARMVDQHNASLASMIAAISKLAGAVIESCASDAAMAREAQVHFITACDRSFEYFNEMVYAHDLVKEEEHSGE